MELAKFAAKAAIVSLGVVAIYHNGFLNFVPVFAGSKK